MGGSGQARMANQITPATINAETKKGAHHSHADERLYFHTIT
jgi:hypothetical protein